jgi:hypothetical protein
LLAPNAIALVLDAPRGAGLQDAAGTSSASASVTIRTHRYGPLVKKTDERVALRPSILSSFHHRYICGNFYAAHTSPAVW